MALQEREIKVLWKIINSAFFALIHTGDKNEIYFYTYTKFENKFIKLEDKLHERIWFRFK